MLRGAMLAAIFFAMGALSSSAFAQNADVREELETGLIATPKQRAEIFARDKQWEKLGAHARKWTREFPGESEAWRYLGRAHSEQGDAQAAANAFSRAWDLSDKKDFRIIEAVGDSYAGIKEWERAEDAYRAALKLREGRAALWAKLADMLTLRRGPGWRQNAAAALKKTLSFGQYINDYDRWRQYAEVLDAINAPPDEQYLAYRHAVRLKVRDIPAWERLYEIEEVRGNTENVEQIADNLLRLDRQNPIAHLHFGVRALEGGLRSRALEHLNIALQSDELPGPRRSRIYAALGDMHPNPAEALPFYRKAVGSDPSNFAAWEQAIIILRGLGQRKEAQEATEQLLSAERKLKKNGVLSPKDASAVAELPVELP